MLPESSGSLKRADLAKRPKMRILPLGASITWGQNSASGNGYRKPLRDQLQGQGYEVDMVGTKKHGNMEDNVTTLTLLPSEYTLETHN